MKIIQGILLLAILIGVIIAQASIIIHLLNKYSLIVAAIQCCFGQKGLDQVEDILQFHAEQQKVLKEQEKQKKASGCVYSAKRDYTMGQSVPKRKTGRLTIEEYLKIEGL